ncbi:IQ motif and ankyrin repeat domain-containing protein 1 isoform X3 [Podarcis raffonei]|uniref:IQ motif and ankyrin repeat domain-containing protein 1 isoform X3 n=1 Tax=Podarcis raffonei TaxID=65483 RepID=UPI0023295E87|nr:IQ motif and ankyrin repeat domain-containing protein 1 isoform X3 [Podarcis raffonei]
MSAKKAAAAGKPPLRKGAKPAAPAKGGPGKADAALPSNSTRPQEVSLSSHPKELTREAKAALTLQSAFRRILACRERARRLQERQEYNELMDRLQREAFAALVKREREEAERERKKEEEEKKKQREEQQRRKRMLEAAFDGDVEEMKAVLKEIWFLKVADLDTKSGLGTDERGKALRLQHRLNMVDCTDANGNTPLSEASGGGHPDAIRMLIENGANPNSRPPLFLRALLTGLLCIVLPLGATWQQWSCFSSTGLTLDSMLMTATPQSRYQPQPPPPAAALLLGLELQVGCFHQATWQESEVTEREGELVSLKKPWREGRARIASLDSLVAVLNSWDISLTESMLQKMEAEEQRRAQQDKKQKEAETRRMTEEVEQLAKEHERCSKELQQAYCELNRRITEHDKCQRKQMDNAEITLRAIADAESLVQRLRAAAEDAEEKVSLARLKLREQMQEGSAEEFRGLKCSVQELDDVLLKDVGGKIHADGRWPLVIDPSGQAAIFLRYRDTNFLNTVNPSDMAEETIRLALLGSLRYGKPLVFDMMEVNMFDTVKKQLERLKPGLAEALLDKKILQNERYLSLRKPTDGPEYAETEFQAARIEKFKLFIVTKQQHPPEEMLQRLLPIQVILSRKRGFRRAPFSHQRPFAL